MLGGGRSLDGFQAQASVLAVGLAMCEGEHRGQLPEITQCSLSNPYSNHLCTIPRPGSIAVPTGRQLQQIPPPKQWVAPGGKLEGLTEDWQHARRKLRVIYVGSTCYRVI